MVVLSRDGAAYPWSLSGLPKHSILISAKLAGALSRSPATHKIVPDASQSNHTAKLLAGTAGWALSWFVGVGLLLTLMVNGKLMRIVRHATRGGLRLCCAATCQPGCCKVLVHDEPYRLDWDVSSFCWDWQMCMSHVLASLAVLA